MPGIRRKARLTKVLAITWMIMMTSIILTMYMKPKPTASFDPVTSVITDNGAVTQVINSIQHQGKLVVTDLDTEAQVTNHLDSYFWDATVTSISKARIQIYLDLGDVKSDWVKQNGKDLTITIPSNAIKSDVIRGADRVFTNGSYAWYFKPSKLVAMQAVNKSQLADQFNVTATKTLEGGKPLVAAHLGRLFSTVLEKQGYHIVVEVK